MSIVLNGDRFVASLRRRGDEVDRRFSFRLRRIVRFLMEGVTSRTPVHTGRTVRNWRATTGAPFGGVLPALGAGQPGETSEMPLGSEPRRGVNQEDALQTLRTLSFRRPYRTYFVANNAPGVDGLEAGLLPEPGRSRSPAGMLGITLAELEARLRSGGFR